MQQRLLELTADIAALVTERDELRQRDLFEHQQELAALADERDIAQRRLRTLQREHEQQLHAAVLSEQDRLYDVLHRIFKPSYAEALAIQLHLRMPE